MANLWESNTPAALWGCPLAVSDEAWQAAIRAALPVLGLPTAPDDLPALLALTLGEGQFGPDHWRLSAAKRVYYQVKPLLPRRLTRWMRQRYRHASDSAFPLGWPIEARYAQFQWEVLRQLLLLTGQDSLAVVPLWPQGRRFALVLTHDIETAAGQAAVRQVADLDERCGFRSSFNFVPERYPLDHALIAELTARGFEVGLHGLKHDGKLFRSRAEFTRRAARINHYRATWGAFGFRSPYTLRQPEWMQALDVEYDSSFFDTDPFEPLAGGTMSLWPFVMGHLVELPYTLVQDYTLTSVLGETSARLWLEKTDFIAEYHGMALLNSHPDYLKQPAVSRVYEEFLRAMQQRNDYWHALPREVARWWRRRSEMAADPHSDNLTARVTRTTDGIRWSEPAAPPLR